MFYYLFPGGKRVTVLIVLLQNFANELRRRVPLQ
jgi:hypothetical protein